MAEIFSDLVLQNLEVKQQILVSGEYLPDVIYNLSNIVNDLSDSISSISGVEVGDLSQRITNIEEDLGSNDNSNIYIGIDTGSNNVGTNNIFIGNELGMNNTLTETFLLGPSGTPLLRGDLTSNKLGINFTTNRTPNYTLEVNGDISSINLYTDSNVLIQGNLNICGETIAQNVTVNELNCLSDRTLKKDIDTIKNALDIIQELRPVKYRWNHQNDQEEQIGFIAQEVEKVIPSIVQNTNIGKKAIAYQKIVPILTQGIQEYDNQSRFTPHLKQNEYLNIGNLLTIHDVTLNSYNLGELILKKCGQNDDFFGVYCGNRRFFTKGVCGVLVEGEVAQGAPIYKSETAGVATANNTARKPIGKALKPKITQTPGVIPVLLF